MADAAGGWGVVGATPGVGMAGVVPAGMAGRLGSGTVLLARAGLIGVWPGSGDVKLGKGAGADTPAARGLAPGIR